MTRRRHRVAAVLAGAFALLATGLVAPAQAAAGNATVFVLHAVPGATVDVYANGDELLTDFEPGTLTDAVSLPAGGYDLKVTEAGAGADGDALIEANGCRRARRGERHGRRAPGRRRQPRADAVRQRHVERRRRQGPADRASHRRGPGRRRARRREPPSSRA